MLNCTEVRQRTLQSLILTGIIIVISSCSTPTALVSYHESTRVPAAQPELYNVDDGMDFHERTGFYYSFEYDEGNLYLRLATADINVQRKMVLFGFTVWVDTTGRKNRQQGFRFPAGARVPSAMVQSGERFPALPSRNRAIESLLAWTDEIELIGIYGTSSRRVKLRDSRIRVNTGFSGDVLLYSARIPYEVIGHGNRPFTGRQEISIGFETGYFERPSFDRRGAAADRGAAGERMRPVGGGAGQMTGGRQGQMPYGRQEGPGPAVAPELSRPSKLWIRLEFPAR